MLSKPFIRFTLISISITLIACLNITREKIKGNQNVIIENREISSFKHLHIKGAYDILISNSEEYSLVIEGESNILEHVEVYNQQDTLHIVVEKYTQLNPTVTPAIVINGNKLNSIAINGSAKLVTDSIVSSEPVSLVMNGTGDIATTIEADKINVVINGTGKMKINGSTSDLKLQISGAGSVDARALQAKNADVSVVGAGNVTLHAEETLNASVKGAGRVKYLGDPEVTQSIGGAGKVVRFE